VHTTHLSFPPRAFDVMSVVFVSIFLKLDGDGDTAAPIRVSYHGGLHYNSVREHGISYPLKLLR
jgi:hypothetical protein